MPWHLLAAMALNTQERDLDVRKCTRCARPAFGYRVRQDMSTSLKPVDPYLGSTILAVL